MCYGSCGARVSGFAHILFIHHTRCYFLNSEPPIVSCELDRVHRREVFVAILNNELDEFHVGVVSDAHGLVLQASPSWQLLALANLCEGLRVRLLAALNNNLSGARRVELDLRELSFGNLNEQLLGVQARRHPEGAQIARVKDL